ncbi:MAG: hypothetical protein NT007_16985 [Candidatus Kapabacteria bacterium]|nr:hypothetical protein [Candidatus Kapabacteria bacterium]
MEAALRSRVCKVEEEISCSQAPAWELPLLPQQSVTKQELGNECKIATR